MSSQIMEIFSYHTAFLNFSTSSNIVDLVISADYQLIYAVDYNSGFLIFNVSNLIQPFLSYTQNSQISLQSRNIILSINGTLVYFSSAFSLQIANVTDIANVKYYGLITFKNDPTMAIIAISVSAHSLLSVIYGVIQELEL